jgi:phytanoyl-CoA hydroxylase
MSVGKTGDLTPQQINRMYYRYDNVHKALNHPREFTEDQKRRFQQDGFVAIEQVLSPDEVNMGLEAIMDLLFVDRKGAKIQFTKPVEELVTKEARELAVRKVYEFAAVEERLNRIAHHPVILDLVARLMGEEPRMVQDMALLKPPHGGGEKPWHQDMAYGNLIYTKPVIGVWIALDEAELDNGCMHVIPGSHQFGGTPHYSIRDWQLCDAHVPVERDVAVPLKPGGVLLFHGLLYHGTPSNFSAKRRRALQFHYAPASAGKMSGEEYRRMFTNALTGAEC